MNKIKFKIVLTIIFLITAGMYLYMLAFVDTDNSALRNSLKPIPVLILLLLYSYESEKINPLVISVFVSTVIADIITNTLSLFYIGIIIYSIAHLFLIRVSGNFLKKDIVKYFLLGTFLFVIIFIYVLSNMGKSYYPIIFYGITMSLTFSVILLNYLNKMSSPNALLLVAFGLRVFSDLIYAITIFNEPNISFDLISLTVYMTSCYIFYRGFVLLDKERNIELKE